MYLAKQQHDDNGDNNDDDNDDYFGESQSTVVGAVGSDVVVKDERRPGSQSTSTQDRETQMRQQLQSMSRSVRDDEQPDDDDDDDNVIVHPSRPIPDNTDLQETSLLYLKNVLRISPGRPLKIYAIWDIFGHRINVALDRASHWFVFQDAARMSDEDATTRVIVIGWDSFRSKLILFLIACLVIWACVFFPLLGTWKVSSQRWRHRGLNTDYSITTIYQLCSHILSRVYIYKYMYIYIYVIYIYISHPIIIITLHFWYIKYLHAICNHKYNHL